MPRMINRNYKGKIIDYKMMKEIVLKEERPKGTF